MGHPQPLHLPTLMASQQDCMAFASKMAHHLHPRGQQSPKAQPEVPCSLAKRERERDSPAVALTFEKSGMHVAEKNGMNLN